jgi:hypothetical protein
MLANFPANSELYILTSVTVALESPGPTSTFKIHKDLLKSKSKIFHAALTSEYLEGQVGV